MPQPKSVLIATIKLGSNYGGILQAYALQHYLRQLGIDAATTDFHQVQPLVRYGQTIKYLLRRILHSIKPSVNDMPPGYELVSLDQHTSRFIAQYIQTVPAHQVLESSIDQHYAALLVGSDQVWRAKYTPVEKYLFDFAQESSITRLSYAASFGKEDLSEYSPDLLRKTAALAKKFKAISVREDSGVELVKQHWDCLAEQHVDPTLLLDQEVYTHLVQTCSNLTKSAGKLFVYVLDQGQAKAGIVDAVTNKLGLQPFEILPVKPNSQKDFQADRQKYQLPPVEQWLKSFIDAEFVITDSFHGVVFSIIFNKPFIAVANQERGLARFTSLLKMFDLDNRLVSEGNHITEELLNQPIDWTKANGVKQQQQQKTLQYFVKNLALKQSDFLAK